MKYEILDYNAAHATVEGNRFLNWDGWDIVTWKPNPKGYSDKRGSFRRGKWGIEFRYPLRNDGTWRVPDTYVGPTN